MYVFVCLYMVYDPLCCERIITPSALGKISQTIREKQSLLPNIDGTISLKEGKIFASSSPLQKPNFPLTLCMVSDCFNVSLKEQKRSCRPVENTWARDRDQMNECYV